MTDIFIKLLNISITAGYLVLAVVLARAVLKKAPKWVSCVLWAMVGIRLVLPFSLKSVLSLIPSAQTIPEDIAVTAVPSINSGLSYLNDAINPVISEKLSPSVTEGPNPMETLLTVAAAVWVAGIIAMLLYGAISYLRLKRRVAPSIKSEGNVYYCDVIDSPFILGIFRPRIYLPSDIDEKNLSYVVSHELSHIKRGDHFWKPLGFLLLSVYWFNPLIWVAYILLCRDIEKACDERVVKDMSVEDKKGYLEALVSYSVERKMISACPLAFGETNVKGRVKSVLNYRKPAFWIMIASVAICIAVSVFFLTDPIGDEQKGAAGEYGAPISVRYDNGEGLVTQIEDYSSQTICSLLNNGRWIKETPNCSADFELDFGGKSVKYHSECGTFYDVEKGKSLELNEKEKLSVNRLIFALVEPNHQRLAELMEKVPQYFGLDASEGLTVYIGELARGSYGCKLVAGNASNDDRASEVMRLSSVGVYDMKLILSTYDLPIDKVSVKHYQPLHSSYLCTYTESCEKRVYSILFKDEALRMANLHAEYPEFFGLDMKKGFRVYVIQTDFYDYKCVLKSGAPTESNVMDDSWQEVMDSNGVCIDDMRLILESYGAKKENVSVYAATMLNDDNELYVIAEFDSYTEKIKKMLFDN